MKYRPIVWIRIATLLSPLLPVVFFFVYDMIWPMPPAENTFQWEVEHGYDCDDVIDEVIIGLFWCTIIVALMFMIWLVAEIGNAFDPDDEDLGVRVALDEPACAGTEKGGAVSPTAMGYIGNPQMAGIGCREDEETDPATQERSPGENGGRSGKWRAGRVI